MIGPVVLEQKMLTTTDDGRQPTDNDFDNALVWHHLYLEEKLEIWSWFD